jgi:hypothetical protein
MPPSSVTWGSESISVDLKLRFIKVESSILISDGKSTESAEDVSYTF